MSEPQEQKLISIMIPCYNEEENIRPICQAVKAELTSSLPEYRYEIVIIDNKSEDHTREIIRALCAEDSNVKAIFNMKNFGQFNSPYYGLTQCKGCLLYTSALFLQSEVVQIFYDYIRLHDLLAMITTIFLVYLSCKCLRKENITNGRFTIVVQFATPILLLLASICLLYTSTPKIRNAIQITNADIFI